MNKNFKKIFAFGLCFSAITLINSIETNAASQTNKWTIFHGGAPSYFGSGNDQNRGVTPTNGGSVYEEHHKSSSQKVSNFVAKLMKAEPWYKPDTVVDTSTNPNGGYNAASNTSNVKYYTRYEASGLNTSTYNAYYTYR